MASKNSVQRILLEKTSSIDGVMDLSTRIQNALAISNKIEFDLSSVAEMELPVIQVLYAAAQSAVAAGGEATLVGSVHEAVAARLLATGFSKTMVKDGTSLQARMPGFGVSGGRA